MSLQYTNTNGRTSGSPKATPLLLFSLHFKDLPEPPLMPLRSREGCLHEDPGNLQRGCLSDDTGSEAEHVHVVVLHPLMSGIGVMGEAGADAFDLVCGDRGANPAAADENPAFRFPGVQCVPHGAGEVGIVIRR